MASPQIPTTVENLPDEVLSEKFIRLLAKQLAQMRCVCKSWNALLSALLSEDSFVKSHLHRSIHHNDEILLFFRNGFDFDSSSFTARPSHSPDLELTNFIKPPVIPQSKNGYGRVIGSVNGLICFSYGSYSWPSCHHLIYSWNPSLSVVLTLSPCSLPSGDMMVKYFHFGFGFDPKTNDYKVVKLTMLFAPFNMLPKVEVYSMRKGSWEFITQRFPSHIRIIFDQYKVCVDGHDGHLHWLGSCDDLDLKPEVIVAFDLGVETFGDIPLPDSLLHYNGSQYHCLGILGGKLCVISRVKGGKCEVWVMNEYGVAESWVKHHAFSQFIGDIIPYGFTSRSEFLFLDHDRFGLYDPIATQTKTFKMTDGRGITTIVEYVDSLVWVAPFCT